MKIEPLTKFENKPVAILNPGRRAVEIQTESGTRIVYGAEACRQEFALLKGWCVYVLDSLNPLIYTTGAKEWTATLWRGREVRMRHKATGMTVTSLRGVLEPKTAFDDLEVVLKWLRSYGVSPGSIPQMAWGLFRASLNRTYVVGADPEVGHAAFYGGRQEITTPGTYKEMQLVDIAQAYPAAMARPEGYALSLRECSNATYLDPTAAGIAFASVYVPEFLPYAPLPTRVGDGSMITYQHGRIEGAWSWCELEAAAKVGAEVTVLKNYAPDRQAELFGPWWPLAQEGRELPGGAGRLAKSISNSTWGQFGMRQEAKQTRSYLDDAGQYEELTDHEDHLLPHSYTAHVAAETTARVRSQVLIEGLYGGSEPVHIDTDGMIVANGSPVPVDTGEPGTWRIKADINELDLRGPQLYRWTCPGCGVSHEHWHYNSSGIPAANAPGFFEGTPVEGPRMTWRKDFDR